MLASPRLVAVEVRLVSKTNLLQAQRLLPLAPLRLRRVARRLRRKTDRGERRDSVLSASDRSESHSLPNTGDRHCGY